MVLAAAPRQELPQVVGHSPIGEAVMACAQHCQARVGVSVTGLSLHSMSSRLCVPQSTAARAWGCLVKATLIQDVWGGHVCVLRERRGPPVHPRPQITPGFPRHLSSNPRRKGVWRSQAPRKPWSPGLRSSGVIWTAPDPCLHSRMGNLFL